MDWVVGTVVGAVHVILERNILTDYIFPSLLVLAGFAAAAGAFRKDLKNIFRPPKIAITYEAIYPFITQSDLFNYNTGDKTKGFFFHAKVTNLRKTVANNCSVQLSKIWTLHEDGFKERLNYIPSELKWATIEDTSDIAIQLNQNRWIDIGFIIGERWDDFGFDREKSIKIGFFAALPRGLVAELAPNDPEKKSKGVHIIQLTVYGSNFKPVDKLFKIEWSGEYSGDIEEIKKELKITDTDEPK